MPHLQERAFSESRHQLKEDNFIILKKPLNWGGGFYVYYTMKIDKLTSRKREKVEKTIFLRVSEELKTHRRKLPQFTTMNAIEG